MKKIKAVFCIILSLTAVVSLFSSCGEHGRKIMNDVYSLYDNLADSIEVTDMDGKTASSFSAQSLQYRMYAIFRSLAVLNFSPLVICFPFRHFVPFCHGLFIGIAVARTQPAILTRYVYIAEYAVDKCLAAVHYWLAPAYRAGVNFHL